MTKYNHMFDIAFTVISENEADKVTEDEILEAISNRLKVLRTEGNVLEAIGICDTYIED